jgi:hypothetical protein
VVNAYNNYKQPSNYAAVSGAEANPPTNEMMTLGVDQERIKKEFIKKQ